MQVNIVLDGERFVIAPRRVEHLWEFLNIIRLQYESQSRRITTLAVNGVLLSDITEAHLRRFWDESAMLTIEISTFRREKHIADHIEDLYRYITKLTYGISVCAEYCYACRLEEMDRYWGYCLEATEWVLRRLQSLESAFLEAPGQQGIRSAPWKAEAESINQVIHRIIDCCQEGDYPQMGELLEGELITSLVRCQKHLENLTKKAA